jgi:protocatechuate 3,4-dioxygenase alpha subunit
MNATPSQTVGPYLAIGLPWADGPTAEVEGHEAVRISGQVFDGAGVPVPDALIETWQPEPAAFARCATDDDGRWHVVVPRTPYVAVHIFARGLLRHLTTRICFEDSAVPEGVPDDRRDTLMPEETDDGYRFDIRIQAHPPERETVFFDL